MDHTGIHRQRGYTTRLALNITLHLLKGCSIGGVTSNALLKNNLITRIYGILAATNLSNQLVPVVPSQFYRFTSSGGSIAIFVDDPLTAPQFQGMNLDCLFSDPGRFTQMELSRIIPNCKNNFIFLDEHNIPIKQSIIVPQPLTTTKPVSSDKISSR